MRYLAALLFLGCASSSEVVLPKYAGDAFRAIVQHDAVTVSDRLTIYGAGYDDARMRCHEMYHRESQARPLADAAVEAGAIRDNVGERALYWVMVYSAESLRANAAGGGLYGGNRFERDARKACP